MTHVCAWCGRTIREIADDDPGESHGICMDCAMEESYTRGWNDALHKMQSKLAGWKKQWGGAPRIPMRATESPQETSEPQWEGYCSGEQD